MSSANALSQERKSRPARESSSQQSTGANSQEANPSKEEDSAKEFEKIILANGQEAYVEKLQTGRIHIQQVEKTQESRIAIAYDGDYDLYDIYYPNEAGQHTDLPSEAVVRLPIRPGRQVLDVLHFKDGLSGRESIPFEQDGAWLELSVQDLSYFAVLYQEPASSKSSKLLQELDGIKGQGLKQGLSSSNLSQVSSITNELGKAHLVKNQHQDKSKLPQTGSSMLSTAALSMTMVLTGLGMAVKKED